MKNGTAFPFDDTESLRNFKPKFIAIKMQTLQSSPSLTIFLETVNSHFPPKVTRGAPFPANDSQRQCHRPIIEQNLTPRDKKITWVESNVSRHFLPPKSSFSNMKKTNKLRLCRRKKKKVFGYKFARSSCKSLKNNLLWGGPMATEQEKR